MRARQSAEVIWAELERAPGTIRDLIRRTGLTRAQVGHGLRFINHQLQLENSQPLAVTRRYTGTQGQPAHIYTLPDAWVEQLPWSGERLRDLLRRARTELARAGASEACWPADVSPLLGHMLRGLVRDIEFTLAQL